MKTQSTESRCYRSGQYTVCRRVRASFSPEILLAGAVKGLYLQGREPRTATSTFTQLLGAELRWRKTRVIITVARTVEFKVWSILHIV